MGPSGCGKSTFLRVVAGLVPPDNPCQFAPPATLVEDPLSLSMNFQSPVLLPWLTVEQNAMLPFELSGRAAGQLELGRLEHLLSLTGLVGFRHAFPAQLSGGMQMRASLIRSFVTQPAVMLMDEPFAALDELTRLKLGIELRALAKKTNVTVLFVTHSVHEAVLLSDRVLVLSARPARVIDDCSIDLHPDRDETSIDSPAYARACAAIRQGLAYG